METLELEPEYNCPTHGNIGNLTLTSDIKGFTGAWCQRCWVEWMDKNLGKATLIEKKVKP